MRSRACCAPEVMMICSGEQCTPRDAPTYSAMARRRGWYQRVIDEGLVSGCDLPLIGRSGVGGVLAALKRSESAFSQDDVRFLEQVRKHPGIF